MNLLKENLERLLQEKGLAPSTFAKAVGLEPSTVLRVLAGKTFPRAGTIATIANYFGLTSAQLIGDSSDSIPFRSKTKRLVPLLVQGREELTAIVGEPASLNGTHQWVSLPFTVDDDSLKIVAVAAKDSALKPDICVGDVVYLRCNVDDVNDVPDGAYVFAQSKDFDSPIIRKFVRGKDFASSFLVSTNPD